MILGWLAVHQAKVVNGLSSLSAQDLEMSKGLQSAVLARLGINTPKTIVYSSNAQMAARLQHDWNPDAPVIVKPDTGGSGEGVKPYLMPGYLWEDASAARVQFPPSGAGVAVQEHIGSYSTSPLKRRSIVRFEIVDGRVLYALQITAPVTEFALCPCQVDVTGNRIAAASAPQVDGARTRKGSNGPSSAAAAAAQAEKEAERRRQIEFRVLDDPTTIPCFQGSQAAYDRFCAKLSGLWAMVGAKVGAVEAFLPVRYADDAATPRLYSKVINAAPMEPIVYDCNFNTNYNVAAEDTIGIHGCDATAEMLQRQCQGYTQGSLGPLAVGPVAPSLVPAAVAPAVAPPVAPPVAPSVAPPVAPPVAPVGPRASAPVGPPAVSPTTAPFTAGPSSLALPEATTLRGLVGPPEKQATRFAYQFPLPNMPALTGSYFTPTASEGQASGKPTAEKAPKPGSARTLPGSCLPPGDDGQARHVPASDSPAEPKTEHVSSGQRTGDAWKSQSHKPRSRPQPPGGATGPLPDVSQKSD
jgi:hypothetical protein